MSPLNVWKRLNKMVNVKHYIGPNSWKVLDDAMEATEGEETGVVAKPDPVKEEEPKKVVLPKKDD